MTYRLVHRIYGERGIVELEPANGKIIVTVIDSIKALEAVVEANTFYEVLLNLVEEEARLLMESRHTCHWHDDCIYVEVPNRGLIAHILLSIRNVLAETPRPTKCFEEDSCEWVWSPQEEAAARKAAILLDLAAMILRHPEAAEKLPRDVDMLIKRAEEGTLTQYLKPKAEAKAQAEG